MNEYRMACITDIDIIRWTEKLQSLETLGSQIFGFFIWYKVSVNFFHQSYFLSDVSQETPDLVIYSNYEVSEDVLSMGSKLWMNMK